MEQKQSELVDTGVAAEGPGAMLRRAREDLRLAPDNVASILRLSAKQILLLEDDNYDSLPGPTYVRGYLRSYAQLLGLSPDRVVDAYQQHCRQLAPPPAEVAAPAPSAATRAAENDQMIRWVAIAVGVVVLLLVVFWWKGRDDSATVARKTDTSTTYVTESGAVIRDPAAATTESTPAAASPAGEPTKPGPATAAAQPGAAPTAAPAPAAVKPAAPVPAAAAPAAVAPAATTPAVIPPAPMATGPRGRLVLRATQESWADVRDARQGRLLYENLTPGRVVTLEGVSPLSVFLGNAEGVQVEYNGQAVDVNRHKRGPMARFTLGEAPSPAAPVAR